MKKNLLAILVFLGTNLFGFQNGEKLTFKINYGVINAGYATIEIEENLYKDSIPTYKIETEAKTNSFFDSIYKVRDNIVSIWDRENGASLSFTKNLREGSYRQRRIQFCYPQDSLCIYSKYDFKGKKFVDSELKIPSDSQDVLSAFFTLREIDFAVGDTIFIPVAVDGDTYGAKIAIDRIEKIDTIFGKKECVVVEPILKGVGVFKQSGRIFIWLTNDEHRIPIKIESKVIVGKFKVVLTEAKNVPY